MYPHLDIYTPKTLKGFEVKFEGEEGTDYDSRDAIYYDSSKAAALGIQATIDGNKIHLFYFNCANGLSEAQWEEFLRTLTFRTYDSLTLN